MVFTEADSSVIEKMDLMSVGKSFSLGQVTQGKANEFKSKKSKKKEINFAVGVENRKRVIENNKSDFRDTKSII